MSNDLLERSAGIRVEWIGMRFAKTQSNQPLDPNYRFDVRRR
jgi:hypothetical protein